MPQQQNRPPALTGQGKDAGQAPFDPVAFLCDHGLIATAAGIRCTSLKGGYQNLVYRLTGTSGDWVVKCFRSSPELALFPNSAEMEARALGMLGPRRIAPNLIRYFSDPQVGEVLVYEYYDGRSWPGSTVPPDLQSVAKLLRGLHALTVDGFRDVPVSPQAILEQGDVFLDTLADRAGLDAVRPDPIEVPQLPRRSLLHTDTGPGNLILGTDGLRLIDWQCPALGDPVEDLCAFLSPAFQILYDCPPLSASHREVFLDAYADDETIGRLRRLEPFFHWRMAAYSAMRRHQYREIRPAASSAYDRALKALIDALQRR